MDAWVHESIFGWTADYVWPDPSKNTVGQWTHPVEEDYFGSPSPYSTNIADAWEVAVKTKLFWNYKLWMNDRATKNRWLIGCTDEWDDPFWTAPTAPLAICRAALRATTETRD